MRRNIEFLTERGTTGEMKLDPIEPWGGFDLVLDKAAVLISQDGSNWVVASEPGCETKIFRSYLAARGLLCSPRQS